PRPGCRAGQGLPRRGRRAATGEVRLDGRVAVRRAGRPRGELRPGRPEPGAHPRRARRDPEDPGRLGGPAALADRLTRRRAPPGEDAATGPGRGATAARAGPVVDERGGVTGCGAELSVTLATVGP